MVNKFTRPLLLLRLEGAAAVVLTVLLYRELGRSWLAFVLLFLVPDVSMLAYIKGPKIGAIAYNVVHTFVGPAAFFALGFILEMGALMGVGLVWGAHIGADRLLGFGLKYPTAFAETHIQRLE